MDCVQYLSDSSKKEFREGESWGKEEVRKLLEEQAGRCVTDKSVRNLLGEFHYESQYSTGHAIYKLPSRQTAENSLRRNQAWKVTVCAGAIRLGTSSVRPPASVRNECVRMVQDAYKVDKTYTVHDGMIISMDDMSVVLYATQCARPETRAVSNPSSIQHWYNGCHPRKENALQEENLRAHSTGPLGRVLADSVDNKVHSSQRCITHARGL